MRRHTGGMKTDDRDAECGVVNEDLSTVACSPEFGSDPESSLMRSRLAFGFNLGKVLLLSTQTRAM